MELEKIIKRHWRDLMMVVFLVFFIWLVVAFINNIETIKQDPCKVCMEQYDVQCQNFAKGIYFDKQVYTQEEEYILNSDYINTNITNGREP